MGSRLFPELSSREAATPLYTFEEGRITVGDYIAALRAAGTRPALEGRREVDRAAWKGVIPESMFWEAARRQGYHELALLLEWKEREEIELLLKALRQPCSTCIAVDMNQDA